MSWSKEDRKIFNDSEVFRNMESDILKNYKKLEAIQALASISDANKAMESGAESAKKYEQAVNGVSSALKNLSSNSEDGEVQDGEVQDHESKTVKGDGFTVTVNKNTAEDSMSEEDLYFHNTIDELKTMANNAAMSGNIKLAYKIERAIDEIIEVRDENK